MAKYYGKIGFAETVETEPGVWQEQIIERDYYGDLIRNNRRYDNSQYLNDNVNINNQFSVLADEYANSHIGSMRYLWYMGQKWKINSASIEYPRITLEVGGLYNE